MAYSTNNLTAAHALHNNQDDTQTQNNPKTNAKSQQLLQKLLTDTEPNIFQPKPRLAALYTNHSENRANPFFCSPHGAKYTPKSFTYQLGKFNTRNDLIIFAFQNTSYSVVRLVTDLDTAAT